MNAPWLPPGADGGYGMAANAQMLRLLSDFQRMQRERDDALNALQNAYQDRLRLAIVTEFQADGGVAHLVRIGCLAEWLALGLGVPTAQARQLRNAAFLYGIGLQDVPQALAEAVDDAAPDALPPVRGPQPLHLGAAAQTPLDLGCEVAYGWKERWDGQGQPAGLAGLQIPLSARIVAVANLLDGLWHADRCGPNEPDELLRHLRHAAGRWLDPQVVAVALAQHQDLWLHLRQAEAHRPAMADLLRDF